jgi:TRAP-type C4-dicarboxylate transport system substrate-binding protein
MKKLNREDTKMKKSVNRSRITWLFVSCLVGLLLVGSSGAIADNKKIELSLATTTGPTGDRGEATKWWVDQVHKRTQGRVNIKVYWGGTVAGSREILDVLRSGAADLADDIWGAYYPRELPLRSITSTGIGFRQKVLARWLAAVQLQNEFPEFDRELTSVNAKRLTYYGGANVSLISKNPIHGLEDLRGIRVRSSGVFLPTIFKAVGSVIVFTPGSEVFDALSKGMVEATTTTPNMVIRLKYHEAAKYLLNLKFGADPGMGMMINLDSWKQLPIDIQQILLQLDKEFTMYYAEADMKRTSESLKRLQESGVKIADLSPEDVAAWRNMPGAKGLAQTWVEQTAKSTKISKQRLNEIVERFSDLIDEYEKTYPQEW